MADASSEQNLLNEFHQQLAAKDQANQASTLRNGFLPDTTEVLIEAGIRCIPLIESGNTEVSDSACDRLKAILFKLKLSPVPSGSRKVMDQFEALLQEHNRKGQSNLKFGFALIVGLSILVGGLILFIAYIIVR